MRAFRTLFLVLFCIPASSSFAQTLPADAQQTCTVSQPLFNSWFQSGSVSLNGAVNPANSLTLDTTPNCNFYSWSEQMFLWLTSPSTNVGSGRVFNSAPFYDVSPSRNKKRVFIPHDSGSNKPLQASLRPAKPGPNGLPAVVDRRGRLIEVASPPLASSGRPMIRGKAGKNVEVARVVVGPDNRAVFFDQAGKEIAQPKPILRAGLQRAGVAQRFFTDKHVPILIDPSGNVLDVDPAQAGGAAVLLAQNGSVIYYSVAVNDVFAYFLTGVKNGAITPGTSFPTSQSDLNQIIAYAANRGRRSRTRMR
jgi:hypothetical protein